MEDCWDAAILGAIHACEVAHYFHILCTLHIVYLYVTHTSSVTYTVMATILHGSPATVLLFSSPVIQ